MNIPALWKSLVPHTPPTLSFSDLACALRPAKGEPVPARTLLYKRGEPARCAYVVESGRVRLVRKPTGNRPPLLAVLGPGCLFGEEGLLPGGIREEEAETLEETRLGVVEGEGLERWIARNPAGGKRLLGLLVRRCRDLGRRLEDRHFRDVPARLGRMLLRLSEEFPGGGSAERSVDLRLTHKQLAEMIGSTRETVTLVLNGFRRRGWLRWEGKRITLLEPEKLEEPGKAFKASKILRPEV